MRYTTKLSEKDKGQLHEGFRNGSTHRYRIRCQSILLSNQGYNNNQLASMFQVDRDTISRWFSQWEEKGLTGLSDKPRSGRPAKLRLDNPEHIQEVKKQVNKECQSLDKVRSELVDSLQVEVSGKTLKRFLKSPAWMDGLVMDGSASGYP